MQILTERLSIFDDLYTNIRIIDPIEKKSINFKGDKKILESSHCYSFWKTGKQCDNCIVSRAKKENKSFLKLEFLESKIYLIQAIPTRIHDKNLIVELIKDITEQGIVVGNYENNVTEVQHIIKAMNDQLVIDKLTGVYNRKFIEERLPVELEEYSDKNLILAVIMMDIDYFKNVNDTYGHAIGDEILKKLAQLIKSSIYTEKDWVARYGGDEFLIVLKRENKDSILQTIEQIKTSIEEHLFSVRDHPVSITCSFGVKAVDEFMTFDDVIKESDLCLYEAKALGRNRAIIRD